MACHRIPAKADRRFSLAVLIACQTTALGGCPDPSKPAAATDVAVPAPESASAATPTSTPERSGALNLRVTVERDAWTVDAHGSPGTGACAAISDLSGLTRCAQLHKASFPDETNVVVTAEPAVPFQRLIETVDALRADARGELFPEFNLAPPKGVVALPAANRVVPQTSAPASSSLPLTVLKSVAEPSEEATVIRISKTQITVGDEVDPVVVYGSTPLADGLPAAAKANGRSDLYIVPLGRLLARYREQDVKLRAAKGADTSTSDAIIVADETTPYRVLFEVVYTAGQSEFGRYHLVVRKRAAE
jgi:biopolymer transport protein ExbD